MGDDVKELLASLTRSGQQVTQQQIEDTPVLDESKVGEDGSVGNELERIDEFLKQQQHFPADRRWEPNVPNKMQERDGTQQLQQQQDAAGRADLPEIILPFSDHGELEAAAAALSMHPMGSFTSASSLRGVADFLMPVDGMGREQRLMAKERGVDQLPAFTLEQQGIDRLPAFTLEQKGIDRLPAFTLEQQRIDQLPAMMLPMGLGSLEAPSLEAPSLEAPSLVTPTKLGASTFP